VDQLWRLRHVATREPFSYHLLQKINFVEIDCRLSLGDLEGALAVVRSSHAGEAPCYVLARVDLASGRPDRAAARLISTQLPVIGDEIRRLVLLACAELQNGWPLRADDNVRRAVDIGRDEGSSVLSWSKARRSFHSYG